MLVLLFRTLHDIICPLRKQKGLILPYYEILTWPFAKEVKHIKVKSKIWGDEGFANRNGLPP